MNELGTSTPAEYVTWESPETTTETSEQATFSKLNDRIDSARSNLIAKLQEKLQEDAGNDIAQSFAREQAKDDSMELIQQSLSNIKDLFAAVKVESHHDPVLANAVHDGGGMSGAALLAGLVSSRIVKSFGKLTGR